MRKSFFRIVCWMLLLLCPVWSVSCKKSNTYADYVEAEDDAIERFISRNDIAVTSTCPQDTVEWMDGNRELYYLYNSGKADGLYYHLVELGDGDQVPQEGWTAYVRYIGKTMSEEVVYDCTAAVNPDPLSFVIQKDAYRKSYGRGFQQAVCNLRVGGHCKVIIPFSIGNHTLSTLSGGSRSDYENYQPMFYEIWLVGLE